MTLKEQPRSLIKRHREAFFNGCGWEKAVAISQILMWVQLDLNYDLDEIMIILILL